jgi:hypothetical protein
MLQRNNRDTGSALMRNAASELYDVLEAFAREGGHPVRDVLKDLPEPFTSGRHYPLDDVEDAGTGCAWYYHAHAPNEARRTCEHGHFHCFMYTELVDKAAQPIALPDDADFDKGGLIHIIAISFDSDGVPTRLFAPNRWVTGEWMYGAEDVIAIIARFSIASDNRFALTSRWLEAMLRLCRPQIASVLRERDHVLRSRREIDPEGFTEDRSLEIVSSVDFDLDAQLVATSVPKKIVQFA